jgi:hypothetical protein
MQNFDHLGKTLSKIVIITSTPGGQCVSLNNSENFFDKKYVSQVCRKGSLNALLTKALISQTYIPTWTP